MTETYSEMRVGQQVEMLEQLQAWIEQYGLEKLLGVLMDTCYGLADRAAMDLVYFDTETERKKESLRKFQLFTLAHSQIFDAMKAVKGHDGIGV